MEYKEYNGTPEELAEYFENDKFEIDFKVKPNKLLHCFDERIILADGSNNIFHISDYYYFNSKTIFKAVCILLKKYSIVLFDNKNRLIYSNDKKFDIFQKYNCLYMAQGIYHRYLIKCLFLQFYKESFLECTEGKTWYTNMKDLKNFLIKNAEINSVSYKHSDLYDMLFNIDNNLFAIELPKDDAIDILRQSNYGDDYYDFMRSTYEYVMMNMEIFKNMPESEKLKFEIKRGE